MPSARGFDGVDVADHVGDGDVGCGEFLDISAIARNPGNRRGIAFLGHPVAAGAADRIVRIVVDFAARNGRQVGVQKTHQAAKDASLCLAAQAQQNKMMLRKKSIHDLRNHGIFVTVDAGEERLSPLEFAQQVLPQFLLDGSIRQPFLGPFALTKLTERCGLRFHEAPKFNWMHEERGASSIQFHYR